MLSRIEQLPHAAACRHHGCDTAANADTSARQWQRPNPGKPAEMKRGSELAAENFISGGGAATRLGWQWGRRRVCGDTAAASGVSEGREQCRFRDRAGERDGDGAKVYGQGQCRGGRGLHAGQR